MHFFCKHAFHRACLGNEEECSLCAPHQRCMREHKQMQQQRADAHEDFYKQLELSPDGFTTVSDCLARGMFSAGRGVIREP